MNTNNPFTLTIGSWSGKGHSEEFRFIANKPIEDVRAAYYAATKQHPTLCPETYCDKHNEPELPNHGRQGLREAGYALREDASLGVCALDPEGMASTLTSARPH